MPLYEYECRQCGRHFEIIQKFSDAPLTTCSECGGPLEKMLSAPAIQFKGSGWYITDYARQGSKGPTKDSTSSESSSSASSEKNDKSSAKKDQAPKDSGAKT